MEYIKEILSGDYNNSSKDELIHKFNQIRMVVDHVHGDVSTVSKERSLELPAFVNLIKNNPTNF